MRALLCALALAFVSAGTILPSQASTLSALQKADIARFIDSGLSAAPHDFSQIRGKCQLKCASLAPTYGVKLVTGRLFNACEIGDLSVIGVWAFACYGRSGIGVSAAQVVTIVGSLLPSGFVREPDRKNDNGGMSSVWSGPGGIQVVVFECRRKCHSRLHHIPSDYEISVEHHVD